MESNACGWKPESQTELQPLSSNNTITCSETQPQWERLDATQDSHTAKPKGPLMPSTLTFRPPPPSSDWHQNNPFAVDELEPAPQPSRQLLVSRDAFASSVRLLPTEPPRTSEVTAFGAAPPRVVFDPSGTQGTGFSKFTGPQIASSLVAALCTAPQEQHISPKSSDVSTCLEELPLEHLLGRLSDKDIRILMQATLSNSSASIPTAAMQFPASMLQCERIRAAPEKPRENSLSTAVNKAVLTHHAALDESFRRQAGTSNALVPHSHTEHSPSIRSLGVSARLRGSVQLGLEEAAPICLSGVPSAPRSTSPTGPSQQDRNNVKKQKSSTNPQAHKAGIRQRSCAVQTTLRMKYRELRRIEHWKHFGLSKGQQSAGPCISTCRETDPTRKNAPRSKPGLQKLPPPLLAMAAIGLEAERILRR